MEQIRFNGRFPPALMAVNCEHADFGKKGTHILCVEGVCKLLIAPGCLKMHPQPFHRTEWKQ